MINNNEKRKYEKLRTLVKNELREFLSYTNGADSLGSETIGIMMQWYGFVYIQATHMMDFGLPPDAFITFWHHNENELSLLYEKSVGELTTPEKETLKKHETKMTDLIKKTLG